MKKLLLFVLIFEEFVNCCGQNRQSSLLHDIDSSYFRLDEVQYLDHLQDTIFDVIAYTWRYVPEDELQLFADTIHVDDISLKIANESSAEWQKNSSECQLQFVLKMDPYFDTLTQNVAFMPNKTHRPFDIVCFEGNIPKSVVIFSEYNRCIITEGYGFSIQDSKITKRYLKQLYRKTPDHILYFFEQNYYSDNYRIYFGYQKKDEIYMYVPISRYWGRSIRLDKFLKRMDVQEFFDSYFGTVGK